MSVWFNLVQLRRSVRAYTSPRGPYKVIVWRAL